MSKNFYFYLSKYKAVSKFCHLFVTDTCDTQLLKTSKLKIKKERKTNRKKKKKKILQRNK